MLNPNIRFYHLQPLSDFYIAVLNYLSYLFWMEKRIHNFWTKFEIPDFFQNSNKSL